MISSNKVKALDSNRVITLCGSTRFKEEFEKANYDFTMDGWIVLSVGHYPNAANEHGEMIGCTEEQKIKLDNLHKEKIKLSDKIYVLNPGGYVGKSTASEIVYAMNIGVSIEFMSPELNLSDEVDPAHKETVHFAMVSEYF